MISILRQVLAEGDDVKVRGASTKELRHAAVTLERPLERSIGTPGRHNDVFAAIAETMWVLAGRDDLAFLRHYVPRAPDFSDDDGKTWRGAYGPRLRNWAGADQIRNVVELLRQDPSSRRAVMSLFDPARDMQDSRDIPCTNWLTFTIRNGAIDMAVGVRSNDVIWGFSGINSFEWSVLQEMLATWLSVDVGQVTYFVGSLHVYDRHYRRAQGIVASAPPLGFERNFTSTRAFSTPFDNFDGAVRAWFKVEAEIRTGQADWAAVEALTDPLLRDFMAMLLAHWQFQRGDETAARLTLKKVCSADLRRGADAYFAWKLGTEQLVSPTEMDVSGEDSLVPVLLALLEAKDNMYGPSWKKRGEQISVLANLARKIDRLELADFSGPAGPESLVDTTVDLYVYAEKYRTFLFDLTGVAPPAEAATWSDGAAGVSLLVREGQTRLEGEPWSILSEVVQTFTRLEDSFVTQGEPGERLHLATHLANLARDLMTSVMKRRPTETAEFVAFWKTYGHNNAEHNAIS